MVRTIIHSTSLSEFDDDIQPVEATESIEKSSPEQSEVSNLTPDPEKQPENERPTTSSDDQSTPNAATLTSEISLADPDPPTEAPITTTSKSIEEIDDDIQPVEATESIEKSSPEQI